MNSIYDEHKFTYCLEDVKNIFLSLDINILEQAYEKINLDSLTWFYSKNTSYLWFKENLNELFKIKYKIYKSKKFKSVSEAIENNVACSGLKADKQIIYFNGSSSDKGITHIPSTILINDYYVNIRMERNLKKIHSIISVEKFFYIEKNIELRVIVAGKKAEQSSMLVTFYKDNQKFKSISSSNNEINFNPNIHKKNNIYFYEYSENTLIRIFILSKEGLEIDIYKKNN